MNRERERKSGEGGAEACEMWRRPLSAIMRWERKGKLHVEYCAKRVDGRKRGDMKNREWKTYFGLLKKVFVFGLLLGFLSCALFFGLLCSSFILLLQFMELA